MRITEDAAKFAASYYKALSENGHVAQDDVERLLVFMFIEYMASGYLSWYIRDADLGVIANALRCISGSGCLFPSFAYEDYLSGTGIGGVNESAVTEVRTSEDSVVRQSEASDVRMRE